MDQFDNTRELAWHAIQPFLQFDRPNDHQAVLLQEQMVELKWHLCKTEAGAALFESLDNLLRQQWEALCSHQQAKNQNNPQIT